MEPSSRSTLASGEERCRSEITYKGVELNTVCPNPKGPGLQKLAFHDHVASLFNVVDNVVQNGHRAWEGKVQLGLRSNKFCRVEFPNAWRWKRSQSLQGNELGKPVRTAVLSTSMSTFPGTSSASVAYVAGSDSQVLEQADANFRIPVVPGFDKLLKHPLALVSFVPRELALFFAGAVAGAAAKTVTAPLDRVKLLMQVHGVRMAQEGSKNGISLLEAVARIGKEEGLVGYWKGNVPQVRVYNYDADLIVRKSTLAPAFQSHKTIKALRFVAMSFRSVFAVGATCVVKFYMVVNVFLKLFKGEKEEIGIVGRLAAGACAGMTSTLVTYPLDVLRLRLAVDSTTRSMGQVARTMLREEGVKSFYKGLGPSLLGIAPYIALNFCVFDLVKKSLPEDFRRKPEASFMTALVSASFATAMCYPLDTARRQMQMRGSPFSSFLDAIPGIIARDGFFGLYRGFVPNVLKNLPNSSIRLTTFDAAKNLLTASQAEYQRILEEHQKSVTNS